MGKSRTYSLYLAKAGLTDFEEIFTATAKERILAGDVTLSDSTNLGDAATIFVFENTPTPPNWLSDAAQVFAALPPVKNKSSCAIIVFRHVDRIFATAFAHGWQYIDDTKIESDFGLRVAINSLDDAKVKRIDRSHLGEAIKGVAQSAFQRDLQAFGMDEALDLVRRISGQVEGDDFANSVSGATGLKITKEMRLTDLADIAEEALTRSQSENYKSTGFSIIDKVRPILDKLVLADLDRRAADIIKNGGDNFELSMPGWSEEDVVYYGYSGPGLRKKFPDLLMSKYRDVLGDKISDLTADTIIRKHGVVAEFDNDNIRNRTWSIKKALVGSITLDSGLYAISEGEWYRLDENFKADVDASFDGLKEEWDIAPLTIIQKVSPDGKKQASKQS